MINLKYFTITDLGEEFDEMIFDKKINKWKLHNIKEFWVEIQKGYENKFSLLYLKKFL